MVFSIYALQSDTTAIGDRWSVIGDLINGDQPTESVGSFSWKSYDDVDQVRMRWKIHWNQWTEWKWMIGDTMAGKERETKRNETKKKYHLTQNNVIWYEYVN